MRGLGLSNGGRRAGDRNPVLWSPYQSQGRENIEARITIDIIRFDYLQSPHCFAEEIPVMSSDLELIRRPEVLRITGLKKSTLYSLMRRSDDPFPPNYPTSERGRSWIRSEVLDWCERRRRAKRTPTPIEKAVQVRNIARASRAR